MTLREQVEHALDEMQMSRRTTPEVADRLVPLVLGVVADEIKALPVTAPVSEWVTHSRNASDYRADVLAVIERHQGQGADSLRECDCGERSQIECDAGHPDCMYNEEPRAVPE